MTRKWFELPGEAIIPFMFFIQLEILLQESAFMAAFITSSLLPL